MYPNTAVYMCHGTVGSNRGSQLWFAYLWYELCSGLYETAGNQRNAWFTSAFEKRLIL